MSAEPRQVIMERTVQVSIPLHLYEQMDEGKLEAITTSLEDDLHDVVVTYFTAAIQRTMRDSDEPAHAVRAALAD